MANHPHRNRPIIRSESASLVPGDTLRAMTAAHSSTDGRVWPRGTRYTPLYAGGDNTRAHDVHVVLIRGERVAFSR